jgi:hypothetical protein
MSSLRTCFYKLGSLLFHTLTKGKESKFVASESKLFS